MTQDAAMAFAAPPWSATMTAGLAGHGLARIPSSRIAAERKRPQGVPEGWKRVSPSLLRYSDEQSIAGVAAVFEAILRMGADPTTFADWGVVAASRFLGRANLSQVLRKFAAEGVWGTSPHLIPHFALHSPSGTISLAIGGHGPNLGVGAGLHAAAEGFLAATTWLETGVVPGVWLVLTGWSPEYVPAAAGTPGFEGECQALALALTRPASPAAPRVRVSCREDGPVVAGPSDLARLDAILGAAPREVTTLATDPTGGVRVTWEPAGEGRP